MVALYAFEAERPDELSLSEGMKVEVVSTGGDGDVKADRGDGETGAGEGWWMGQTLARKRGIFPMNYVQALPKAEWPAAANCGRLQWCAVVVLPFCRCR